MTADDRRIDPHEAVDYIIKHAPRYAKAKAERVYLEEFRKSKKAILMQAHAEKPIGAQEREAYADPEYTALLDAIKISVQDEETEKWMLIAAQARVDLYRTQSANDRRQDRATA